MLKMPKMPKMQGMLTMLQTQMNEFNHTKPFLSQRPGHKKGGRRWSPPGGYNPPATEGVPTACEIEFKLALSNHSWPLSTFFRAIRPEVFETPILSFPQEPGDHRSPAPKNCFLCLVGSFWSIFAPSEPHSKNDIEKTSKKVRKLRILASQTPPKTLPKSIQNRGPKKHAIFHGFLLIFGCLLQEPNLKFHAPTQCFVSFSQKSSLRFWHALLVQKTYQEPFQKEVRTLLKSMPQTCCFLTSFFSGFGLDFGAPWAPKVESSWPPWPKNFGM